MTIVEPAKTASLRVDDPDFRLYVGHALEQLAFLESDSVDCVVTSPPYFGLRDYGTGRWEGGEPDCEHAAAPARSVGNSPSTSSTLTTNNGRGPEPGDKYVGERHRYADKVPAGDCPKCGAVWVDDQIGLERTPGEYVANLVEIFREVRRVLAPHGTVWLNLGDSYASDGVKGTGGMGKSTLGVGSGGNGISQAGLDRSQERQQKPARKAQVRDNKAVHGDVLRPPAVDGLAPKQRMMIPARVALALQDDGWWIRGEIVWDKMSPMPESVTDRPTNTHEMIYMLTKRPLYFYDRVASLEPYTTVQPGTGRPDLSGHPTLDESLEPEAAPSPDGRRKTTVRQGENSVQHRDGERWPHEGRNMRSVWRMPTANMPEAHFAVFPEELVRKALTAGCPTQVCRVCGKPRVRVVETSRPAHQTMRQANLVRLQGSGADRMGGTDSTTFGGEPPAHRTVAWSDCGCATGLAPDDYELIESPMGEGGDDPSLLTGRKGMNRERPVDGGVRPITRYEQRQYAAQLAALSKGRRRIAEKEAGPEAFAHYLRTDDAGARPVPHELLANWIGKGYLELVELPEPQEGDYRPGLVLDPFMGSGTTALVARKMGLHAVGVELSPKYADMIERRLQQLSLFA